MVTIHTIKDPKSEDISPFVDERERQHYAVAVKGAPDIVLDLCTHYQSIDDQPMAMTEQRRQQILAANDEMTRSALRVLGVAYRVVDVLPDEVNSAELEQDLIFVGLMGMIDPARKEVQPALEKGRGAGIRTIMITGDYPNTAKAIAEDIGLLQRDHQVLTGHDLNALNDHAITGIRKSNRCFRQSITGT